MNRLRGRVTELKRYSFPLLVDRPLDRHGVPRSVVDERTARYLEVKFREFRLVGA